MKIARGCGSFLVLLATLVMAPLGTSFAQMNLTFDYSNLANPDYNGDNIFVTFSAADSNLVFSGTSGVSSILFNSGTLSNGNVTSQSFTLNQLASGTLTVNSATSLIGYISYGTSTGFASGTTAPSPFTTTTRYSNFEFTYSGTSGGADLTNIAQFGGSLKMETYAGATQQGYTQNSLNSGDLFRALAATASSSPSAVITTGTGGTGQFVRVVGPSKFPNGLINDPYPTYNNYLESLYTTSGSTSSVASLQNLKPNTAPGGSGSIGMTSTGTTGGVVSGTTYNADYYFDAYVSPVITGSTTTYQVLLSGSVVMTPATTGTAVTYTGLGILLTADSGTNLYMTNFINQQTNTGNGINVSLTGSANWASLESAFAGATNTLSLKAEGDFSEGILTGLVGSLTQISGTAIGDMTSAQWWENGLSAYAHAQPSNLYYNTFGQVIYDNSGGANTASVSGTFTDGGVYGNPYDDRFQTQLLGLDSSVTDLKISLLADGNLNVVPEPGATALILSGLSLLAGSRLLRGRRKTAV